jgi:DNA-binding transcriptional LysR family regulator
VDKFAALTVFTRVVEQGSFVRAADKLGMSTSAVSRHVSDLEAHLATRLLNRTTRRLSLTESGQAFHERCVQLLADLAEAEEATSATTLVPRGTLRLTSAITFGIRHLAPALADFTALHPQVDFDVELSDRTVDIVEEGLDLAVRIGSIGSQALIARKLATTQMVLVAAPSYLARRGTPRTHADLAAHACLTYEYLAGRNVWRLRDRAGVEHSVRVGGAAHANNGQFLAALAAAGVGIALEPDFIVAPEIRAGSLVPVLPDYAAPTSDIVVAYPSRRHLSAKVRVFVDFLARRFAGVPEWALPGAAGMRRTNVAS